MLKNTSCALISGPYFIIVFFDKNPNKMVGSAKMLMIDPEKKHKLDL